jgi:hypothetical protein
MIKLLMSLYTPPRSLMVLLQKDTPTAQHSATVRQQLSPVPARVCEPPLLLPVLLLLATATAQPL